MRTHAPLFVAAAAVLLVLTGCSPTTEEASSAPAESSPTSSAPEAPSSEDAPEPAASASAPPETCVNYENTAIEAMTPPAGSEGILNAANTAALDPKIAFKPGLQIITSSEVPGSFEAVARICSEPLPEDEFRTAATTIAVAIKQEPTSDLLTVLKVTSWSLDDSGELQRGATLTADYQMYTWDAETSGVPLDKNWDWS